MVLEISLSVYLWARGLTEVHDRHVQFEQYL